MLGSSCRLVHTSIIVKKVGGADRRGHELVGFVHTRPLGIQGKHVVEIVLIHLMSCGGIDEELSYKRSGCSRLSVVKCVYPCPLRGITYRSAVERLVAHSLRCPERREPRISI